MNQATEINLNYCSGQTNNYIDLLKELGINCDQIKWSWYEPKPESLIGTDEPGKTLTPILRKGMPHFPSFEIEYTELMLFFEGGGVILNTGYTGLRYFCFSEDLSVMPIQKETETQSCFKLKDIKVLLREKDILKKQFNLKIDDSYPESLQLIQYYFEEQCIAWTLK